MIPYVTTTSSVGVLLSCLDLEQSATLCVRTKCECDEATKKGGVVHYVPYAISSNCKLAILHDLRLVAPRIEDDERGSSAIIVIDSELIVGSTGLRPPTPK